MLLAVALEDSKTFQNTLNKLIDADRRHAQEARVPGDDDLRLRDPRDAQRQRERQQRAGSRARSAWRSPRTRSSSRASRPCSSRSSAAAAPPWPTAPRYQAVAKEIPDQVSSMSLRPARRAGPRLLRHDQERPVREGPPERRGRRRPRHLEGLASSIDKDKLPDFSVFAKYLSPGGRLRRDGRRRRDVHDLHLAEGKPVTRVDRFHDTRRRAGFPGPPPLFLRLLR